MDTREHRQRPGFFARTAERIRAAFGGVRRNHDDAHHDERAMNFAARDHYEGNQHGHDERRESRPFLQRGEIEHRDDFLKWGGRDEHRHRDNRG